MKRHSQSQKKLSWGIGRPEFHNLAECEGDEVIIVDQLDDDGELDREAGSFTAGEPFFDRHTLQIFVCKVANLNLEDAAVNGVIGEARTIMGERWYNQPKNVGDPSPPSPATGEHIVDDAVPVDQWPKEIDEYVLIFVVHDQAKYEPDPVKRANDWEAWCVGRWTDFNSGGWTWNGLAGTVTHVAPLPKRPAAIESAKGGPPK